MTPQHHDKIKQAAKIDIPAILDELRDKINEALGLALEDDGSGKVNVSFKLAIDGNVNPPAFVFSASLPMTVKISGPERSSDDHPELDFQEGDEASSS